MSTNINDVPHVVIHTDGSYLTKKKSGGYCAVIDHDNYRQIEYGGEMHTTISRMEVFAIVNSLSCLTRPCHVTIYSDSQYAVKSINQYIRNWENNGWMTKQHKQVANIDLMQGLLFYMNFHVSIKAVWIKAHNGHPENELCDQYAKQGALEAFAG